MSQPTKRGAGEAFGDCETIPLSSTKRRRRTKGPRREVAQIDTPTKTIPQKLPPQENESAQKAQKKKKPPRIGDVDMSGQPTSAREDVGAKKAGRRGKKKHKAPGSKDEAAAEQVAVVAKDEAKPGEGRKKKKEKFHGKARENRIMHALSEETPSWIEQGWEMSLAGGYFLDQDPVLSKGDKYVNPSVLGLLLIATPENSSYLPSRTYISSPRRLHCLCDLYPLLLLAL